MGVNETRWELGYCGAPGRCTMCMRLDCRWVNLLGDKFRGRSFGMIACGNNHSEAKAPMA